MSDSYDRLKAQKDAIYAKPHVCGCGQPCNGPTTSARDAALEQAARIADEHWPESGHIPCDGAVSCPMSISIMIRRLKSTYGREDTVSQ